MIVDLFAGPGGWDEGLRMLGRKDVVGIEWDEAAVATARAAGHKRILGDVSLVRIPTERKVEGGIMSPPCQPWSMAGRGLGNLDRDKVHELVDRMALGDDDIHWTEWADPRSHLAAQPVRWVRELRPEWIAMEQVPRVLDLWQHIQVILRSWGYFTWAGILNAADYGVPQTRKRAFLLARAKGTGFVSAPDPTHQEKASGVSRRRWVSMADALQWDGMVGFPRRADGGEATADGYRARDLRSTDQPSFVVTEKARSWTLRHNNQANATVRTLDEPAATIAAGHAAGDIRWMQGAGNAGEGRPRSIDLPAPTMTSKGTATWRTLDAVPAPAGAEERVNDQSGSEYDHSWPWGRPATTIAGRPLVPHPGTNANRFNGSPKSRNDGVRISVEEAATLQSFPVDYPWQGSRTDKFRQIGDAVPPLLAAHVLASLGVGELPERYRRNGWRAEERSEYRGVQE